MKENGEASVSTIIDLEVIKAETHWDKGIVRVLS